MGLLRNRLAKLLFAIAVAAIAAILVNGQLREAEVARRDLHEVARMTQKMKTICVGRFLIDLPEGAQAELASPRIHGLEISAFDETENDFAARLAQREANITATLDRSSGNKNLETALEMETENGMAGKLFVHGRTVTEGTAANGLELERYRYEAVAVEAIVHGNGVSIDVGADSYFPDRIDNLSRLIAQFVPNRTNHVPTEPGFCLDRAFVRDPLRAEQREQIRMFASLPNYPDIEFRFMLLAGTKPDEHGLLERNAESNRRMSLAERTRVSRLRAAPRAIGTLAGEEVVERFNEASDDVVYSFGWEVSGTADNVLLPHISFTMDTGRSSKGPVRSSLSQDAAMALWDKISSSIRFHTPPPAKGSQPVPAATASRAPAA